MVPAAPVLSGTFVSPQSALSLAAVFAAINRISTDIASFPVMVERKHPAGGWVEEPDYPLSDVVCSTVDDGETDSFRFLQADMAHVLGYGNGRAEIVRQNGYVTGLRLLHPDKTVEKQTKSGKLYYELANKDKLAPEDVLHFAGLGFNGVRGWSPIHVCRQTIGLGIAAEQFGAAFFGNGAVPHGAVKTAKTLSPAALANLRNSINQIHQGSQSAWNFLILEEGLDWVSTQLPPEDIQFIATREFQVKDIARIYSLPPHKIGDYSESHLANVEEANQDYIDTTLRGWVRMIESQANLKLLSRDERRVLRIRLQMSDLLRGNVKDRGTYFNVMRNVGAFSTNDILIAEGRNPIPEREGGNLRLVQKQYVSLAGIYQNLINPAPAVPPASSPAAKEPDADDQVDDGSSSDDES